MKAGDKLKDLLNLETKVSPNEARKLALSGRLLKNTTVLGNLNLAWTKLKHLPDNLTVCGHLCLQGTHISSLPANLIVNRNIYMESTQVTSLPVCLQVDGRVCGFTQTGNPKAD